IGENASKAEDARGNAHPASTAGQQCIECVSADPKGAAPIASGNRVYAEWLSGLGGADWRAGVVNKRKINRISCRSGGSSGSKDTAMIAKLERAEEPIKAELFQVGLGDLDELCFDLDLLWTRGIRLFNQGVNHIEVVNRVVHNQCSAMWKESRARPGGEEDTHALEEELGISTTNELTIVK